MVLDLQSFANPNTIEEEEQIIPDPAITVEVSEDCYGKFIIEPLEPGQSAEARAIQRPGRDRRHMGQN